MRDTQHPNVTLRDPDGVLRYRLRMLAARARVTTAAVHREALRRGLAELEQLGAGLRDTCGGRA
jgi:plasmid stability protein